MNHDLWHRYYTPNDIGDRLLASIQSQ
jgi:hypothetical protein